MHPGAPTRTPRISASNDTAGRLSGQRRGRWRNTTKNPGGKKTKLLPGSAFGRMARSFREVIARECAAAHRIVVVIRVVLVLVGVVHVVVCALHLEYDERKRLASNVRCERRSGRRRSEPGSWERTFAGGHGGLDCSFFPPTTVLAAPRVAPGSTDHARSSDDSVTSRSRLAAE